MIDKIWYDWQCRDPVNANSFFGGSVQQVGSLDEYNQYPSGSSPYLSVSTCQFRPRDLIHLDRFVQLNSTMPADGMFPEVAIGDVMNTTGGYLCYVYE